MMVFMTSSLNLKGAKIFVLTGAGISAASGIKTFRDSNGLWRNHNIHDVASEHGFFKSPETVWEFYSERRKQASGCAPSKAHYALANLQKFAEVFVATQNVDNLHENAGTKYLQHIHGELFRSCCSNPDCPGNINSVADHTLPVLEVAIAKCNICGWLMRPDVVWFGESTRSEAVLEHLLDCTHFIAIGTSGSVYPAAMYAQVALQRQIPSVYIGPEQPENAHGFSEIILGNADDVMAEFMASL